MLNWLIIKNAEYMNFFKTQQNTVVLFALIGNQMFNPAQSLQ